MKTILITSPVSIYEEIETIREIFQRGLDILHIRKPGWDVDEMETFIEAVPCEFMSKVALHGYPELARKFGIKGIHLSSKAPIDMLNGWSGSRSRSAHSFQEMEDQADKFDYFFLSPVFDSISKEGYKSNFDLNELQEFLHKPRKYEVIALGGIEERNTEKAIELGFNGVALLGAIWKFDNIKDRIETFEKVAQKCKKKVGTY